MKCFSVSTLPAMQKIHTLSAQASFGLFQRLVSQLTKVAKSRQRDKLSLERLQVKKR